MNKNYTLIYLLENFETKKDYLINYQSGFNEFSDVWELLNQFQPEPSEKVIENILEYSKSLH